jgi:hypothetical protein
VAAAAELLAGEEASGGGASASGGGEWGLKTELPSATRFNTERPPSFSGPRTRFSVHTASSGYVLNLFCAEPVFSPNFLVFPRFSFPDECRSRISHGSSRLR